MIKYLKFSKRYPYINILKTNPLKKISILMEAKDTKKSSARRDGLQELEKKAQKLWESENFFKSDPSENSKKFMATFPYPYMNGKLHLGHAFSMTKCEFTIRYKKLSGYNVLFPFGFHCTGMPICAAAQKLKNDFDKYGAIPPISYKVNPEKEDEKPVFTQYGILKMSGIPESEIPKFVDPLHWLRYFPPMGKDILKRFGAAIDWRRSFITTEINPYYNSFIEWQFYQLKQKDRIKFGMRPSIYSVKDKQMCADHDRAEGEGVGPQEYSLIKLKVLEPYPNALKSLSGKNVFLVAATLRPETMYGQTNCYILPTGNYGAFLMKNDEVFICSERSALNMAYQLLTKTPQKVEKLFDVLGQDILGAALRAPLSSFPHVYALPMLTISMNKGTGIVTSVPSDAPDDWAALRDLQKKENLRKKYNLTDEMVLPFEPVPIIDIPEYGKLSALKACDEFKVTSQNDKELLVKAKEKVYLKGFYEGIMLIGSCKGMKVQEAKLIVRKEMIEKGEAEIYYEPENLVVSRSGDECIVALCDQWYLKYGDEDWKNLLRKQLADKSRFWSYTNSAQKEFCETVEWLKEWGCSRSFGLGTRLPWDKQYLIESLSDSTIYMAYYTIVHHLQGDLEGKEQGDLKIDAQDLTLDAWDYIFLGKPYKEGIKIDEEKLKIMRKEFLYWYPLDLRVSGKDLIKNHLTMCLFNHASIWEDSPELWPKHFFVNGYVQVDGEKMAKSKGNFYTIEDVITQFGADATRIALAAAGDTLDDSNFTLENVDSSILQLSTLEMWMRETAKHISTYRIESQNEKLEFFDKTFMNEMQLTLLEGLEAYESMRHRDALKKGFFEFQAIKDDYKINVGHNGPRKDLIIQYINYQLLLLYPIAPHFCEIMYSEILYPLVKDEGKYPKFLAFHQYPHVELKDIEMIYIKKINYLKSFLRNYRLTFDKVRNLKKKGQDKPTVYTSAKIIIANDYVNWQKKVLVILKNAKYNENSDIIEDWRSVIKANKEIVGDILKKSFQFGSYILQELKVKGKDVLELNLSFDEKEFLKSHEETIKKQEKIENIELLSVEEALKLNNKAYATAIGNSLPGNPQIVFE